MLQKVRKLYRSNQFMSLLGNGSAAVLGLLSFSFIARALSRDDLGIWVFFMTVFTLFDMVRSGMLSNGLIKKIGESHNRDQKREYIGAAWKLSLLITAVITVPISVGAMIFKDFISAEFYFVGKWFWLAGLVSLPASVGIWLLNAYNRFDRLFWSRSISQFVFFLGAGYCLLTGGGIQIVLWSYMGGWLLAGLVSAITGWSSMSYIGYGSKKEFLELYHFGKFSMGTLLGSNLLRSSDTFLLMFFMGPAPVGLYNVPERLLGLLDIPIRSLVSTAYPKLVRVKRDYDKAGFLHEYEVQTGLLTLLVLPIAVVTFVFAKYLVVLLAGPEYEDAALLLQIFAIYTAIIPLDRLSGIALEVFDMPKFNFYKVMLMASVNILGDIIVIKLTGNVYYVAIVSIFTYGSGILFGYYFLRRELPFRPKQIFSKGLAALITMVKKVK